MSAILTEIISLLVAGISGIATGIGSGLSDLVQNIFVTTGEGGAMALSTFGGLIVVFAGVSLAIGLSKWVCFMPPMIVRSFENLVNCGKILRAQVTRFMGNSKNTCDWTIRTQV